jgi:gliding motility-associated-like protein
VNKILTSIFLIITFSLSLNTYAQFNRRDTKKSVAYRANYQRMGTGCQASHSFEIRGGKLWAFGNNANGRLGDGSYTDKNSPVQIGTDSTWAMVVAGGRHSLGLKANGTLWAWGWNIYGQLGDGSTTLKNSPVQIGTDNKWVSISAGQYHSIALKSDGTIWAWGNNAYGQLGDGTTTNRTSPIQIGTDTKWISISAGGSHCLGLKSNGTLWAWGYNGSGQLGDGSGVDKSNPVQIGTDDKWVYIIGCYLHSFALKSDGTLWGSGLNDDGELGDGTSNNTRTSFVRIGTDTKWIQVAGGEMHSLGLKSDGTLWAWGRNDYGQIGDGTTTQKNSPLQIGSDNNWVSILAGWTHTLGLKSNGTLWVWGENNWGQLGDSTNTDRHSPVQMGTDKRFISIAGGKDHSACLKANGTIWAWGGNSNGQCGDGTTTDRYSPVQIGTDTKWVSIVANSWRTFGLKADGTLWAWGNNVWGSLGVGGGAQKNTPTQVGTDNKWVCTAPGGGHTLGLKSDGTLWAWGNNAQGQLGDGTGLPKSTPVQVGSDNSWVSIAAGSLQSLGLKADGTLWAWGDNLWGELGDGTNTNRNAPIQIGSDNKWISISSLGRHSVGLKSNGTIWGWGNNTNGQVGDGTTTDRNSPVQIGTGVDWINISAGGHHCLALKSNGTLWSWGQNVNGELGRGTNIDIYSPAQVGAISNWVFIATGDSHSIGLESERDKFCAVGINYYGQLGDNTTVDKNTFTCTTICSTPSANVGFPEIICLGNTIIIGSIAVEGNRYSWISSPSGFVSAYSKPRVNPIITTKYYLTETDTLLGCSKTDSVIITVNPLPPANVGPARTICRGDTISIGDSAINGHTYSWTSSIGGYSGIVANPTVSPQDTTVYYLTETDTITGCSKTDSVKITVNPLPIATVGSPKTICQGDSVSLGATAIYGNTYSWTSIPVSFVSASSIITVKPIITTNYYLKETDTTTGCSMINAAKITVNPLPIANAGFNRNLCQGDSTTIGGLGLIGNSYSWTSSPIGFISVLANPKVSPTTITTYYLTETVIATSCSKSDSITVTVNSLPAALIDPAKTICKGDSTEIRTASPVPGNIYLWASSPVGFASASPNPTVQPTLTTIYYLTELILATGCFKKDSVKVTVNPSPAAGVGSDTTLCRGEKYTIGTAPVSGSSYSWTSSPIGFTSTLANPVVSPDTTTIYYLTETNTATGCTNSDTVTINILPLLSLHLNTTDTTVCKGNTLTIIASASGGNSNYLYSLKKNNATIQSNATGIFNITASANEIYTVVLSDNCTLINDSVTCKINIFDVLLFTQTMPDLYLCPGETATLKANTTAGHGTLNYLWTDDIGTILSTADSFSFAPNTSLKIILNITDDCTSIYDTLSVYEFPIAVGTQLITDVSNGCVPLTVNFETPILTYSNALPYEALWDFGDGTTSAQNFSNTVSTLKQNHIYTYAGVYQVKVDIKFKNGTVACYTFSTTVEALLIPQIILSIAPKKITLPKTQCIATITTVNSDSVVIDWGDGYSLNLNLNLNLITQTHDYSDTGHYVVKATAFNKNTCYIETNANVYHADTFMCFIPNAFTPNKDATNETFKPVVSFCKSYELTIYNRWGEIVYETKYTAGNGPQPSWSGEGSPMDTYVYTFSAIDIDNFHYSFKGTVMLIR